MCATPDGCGDGDATDGAAQATPVAQASGLSGKARRAKYDDRSIPMASDPGEVTSGVPWHRERRHSERKVSFRALRNLVVHHSRAREQISQLRTRNDTFTAFRLIPSPLARVRGWLFYVDGVLHVGSQPISGAAELLEQLVARNIPFRLLTNTTTASRATLATRLRDMDSLVTEEMFFINRLDGDGSLRAPALPGVPCYLLAKGMPSTTSTRRASRSSVRTVRLMPVWSSSAGRKMS